MQLKLYLLLGGFLLVCLTAKAQFEGISSYDNPFFQNQFKSQHIRTVSEVESRSTYTFFVGRYTLDTSGRIIERFRSSGPHSRIEYNKLSVRTIVYDEKDTSKIAYWKTIEFDEKGRIMKEEAISVDNGKQTVNRTEETKVIALPNGKTRRETYKGHRVIAPDTVFSRDSIAGIYQFTISYEKDRRNKDEGPQRGKKVLTREYVKDNCSYTDEVEYFVYGRLETPKKLEGSYHQTDAKGRQLEYGKIDYENAIEAWFEAHPEDFNMYTLPPMLIRQVFDNKIKGERKPYEKYVYNSVGLLTEKLSFGNTYKFKYNAKKQLVEQIGTGYSNTTDVFFYNDRGSISKMIRTFLNVNGDPTKKEVSESTFTYTYY